MSYWLMKSEPDVYGWDDLEREGEGIWDGVRSHQAKNNLVAMEVCDQAFFYHSNIGREIVGIVEISKAGLTDPTDETGKCAAASVTGFTSRSWSIRKLLISFRSRRRAFGSTFGKLAENGASLSSASNIRARNRPMRWRMPAEVSSNPDAGSVAMPPCTSATIIH